jgi:hypothetical protein
MWQLSSIPKGLYVDEASIGYNAILIATTGHDEHNCFWPLYFKAFGEYKNPIYIYTLALIYKFFGISAFGLRFTSFLFFFLFLVGIYILVTNVFRNNRTISVYILIAAGFLPWFFPISRIAFEVISQLTIVTYTFIFIFKTYHKEKYTSFYASLSGFFLGLSIYSYTTARLLSFLIFIAITAIYFRRETIKKSAMLTTTFLLCFLPYFIFLLRNPNALTARFKKVTYIYDPLFSPFQKINIFIQNYISYFGLDFLLFKGDKILRHATGYGGELFITVYLLFIGGLIWLIIQKKLFNNKFSLFLFTNMLIAPIAASLTIGTHQSLRSILLGLYILIFSCYGLSLILLIKEKELKKMLVAAVFIVVLFETLLYINDYFTRYKNDSISWFESYDFENTLITAIQKKPEEIIVSNLENYALAEFHKKLISNPNQIPIRVDNIVPKNTTCIIYHVRDEALLNNNKDKFSDLSLKNSLIQLRCYD